MKHYAATTLPGVTPDRPASIGTLLPPERPELLPSVAEFIAKLRNSDTRSTTATLIQLDDLDEWLTRVCVPTASNAVFSIVLHSRTKTNGEQIFDAIQSLYLSSNTRRHGRQIADRITALHRDAVEENEAIQPQSLKQFTSFFVTHDLGLPKVTLTPDGTLRARWIHGAGNFVAIEFPGGAYVKLVAEIPRANETAKYFATEATANVIDSAQAIGASFE